MYRTGIRTIVATLAAALTVVVIAPAASGASDLPATGVGEITTVAPAGDSTIASKNDKRFSKSAEAAKLAKAQFCADLQTMFETNADLSEDAENHGYQNASEFYDQQATQALEDGKKQGCAWTK